MGKKIPMWQCLLVMVVLIALIFWAVKIDTEAGEGHIALILAGGFAAVIAMLNGWKWSYMEQGILAAINRTMQAILILAIVGAMLGSWIAGGVVPSMMYFGIKVIAPSIFLFTACLLCAIVSLATGSSWSTAGSMGVALIGVGTALGFPTYMTTGPSLVIALVVYLVLGFTQHSSGDANLETINQILEFIKANYNVSILCLIPPLFVIIAVAMKLPALPALLGGVLLGLPFFPMQGRSIIGNGAEGIPGAAYILNRGVGVDVPDGADLMIEKLCSLLTSDGMQGMMGTISLILCAMVFGGIVDSTGIMGSLAEALLKLARGTRGGLVTVTIISCIIVNILCSDQYLAIILPGRMYKEAFEDLRLAPKNLSRCLEDSGTITSNFVPWNTCGATMSKFLQCPQWGKGGDMLRSLFLTG